MNCKLLLINYMKLRQDTHVANAYETFLFVEYGWTFYARTSLSLKVLLCLIAMKLYCMQTHEVNITHGTLCLMARVTMFYL